MTEDEPQQEDDLTQEFIDALRDMSEHGVDFTEEDIPWILEMEEDELAGLMIGSLLEAGVVEPDAYLESLGFIEKFRLLTAEELQARNSRKLEGTGYKVDELDEQDRQRE
jgi:hypothetical protein